MPLICTPRRNLSNAHVGIAGVGTVQGHGSHGHSTWRRDIHRCLEACMMLELAILIFCFFLQNEIWYISWFPVMLPFNAFHSLISINLIKIASEDLWNRPLTWLFDSGRLFLSHVQSAMYEIDVAQMFHAQVAMLTFCFHWRKFAKAPMSWLALAQQREPVTKSIRFPK